MQVYLVGGAVRDQLLGLPIKERDWVVVGARPDEMIALGYKQVGRDFPVFLHPQTKEEYALARTERKTGQGYYGFECVFSPDVTLEEDLLRRDLTINAMAMDASGKLIDPYHGQKDLELRVMRHVSQAFVEDPVRALRLARFQARFHHLGFHVADETRLLVYQMAKGGELSHLVPERVWQEWERSLSETNPEQFILCLRQSGALSVILPELDALFGVPASKRWHPEIDSGVHTLEVMQAVRSISSDPVLGFMACLHDLGKAQTPMDLWPSHAGHDARGLPIVKNLCERLRVPGVYRDAALLATAYHLKIHAAEALDPDHVVHTLIGSGAFRDKIAFRRLLTLCEADSIEKPYVQPKFWERCLAQCEVIEMTALLAKGLKGPAMKAALHEARVIAVRSVCEKQTKSDLD